MKLSIVIPSWNTRELLRACLASLRRADLPEHETIVIDNASADGSADMVERDFPEVVLQRNARNEGFAIGCNQGLRRARGESLLLLNADTEVAPDALRRMLEFLAAHPRHGAIAPRLVSSDGSTQRTCLRFPSVWTPLFFGGPLERWFPDNFELRRYFMRDWDQQSSRDVDQPPAAALIVRRAALDEVGLFDEALWLFYNDVDLSKRLTAAGWKTHYLAEATVLHHIGASTKQFGNFLPEWHKNRLHYYRKHHGWLAGVWVKLCTGIAALDWSLCMLARRATRKPSEPIAPLWTKYWSYVRL